MGGIKGQNLGEQNGQYKHGASFTRLYGIWASMKERCGRPKHPHYHRYGGRGISVCKEWEDFIQFRDWAVSNGYSDALTIDRINNDGNYEPSNCRWVTMKEQHNNTSQNRIVEYRGGKYTISQLSDLSGVKYSTLRERINYGWSVEDAAEKPVKYHSPKGMGNRKEGK